MFHVVHLVVSATYKHLSREHSFYEHIYHKLLNRLLGNMIKDAIIGRTDRLNYYIQFDKAIYVSRA